MRPLDDAANRRDCAAVARALSLRDRSCLGGPRVVAHTRILQRLRVAISLQQRDLVVIALERAIERGEAAAQPAGQCIVPSGAGLERVLQQARRCLRIAATAPRFGSPRLIRRRSGERDGKWLVTPHHSTSPSKFPTKRPGLDSPFPMPLGYYSPSALVLSEPVAPCGPTTQGYMANSVPAVGTPAPDFTLPSPMARNT